MKSELKKALGVDERLNLVNYDFVGYIPSEYALMFVNFIKEVNGGNEENETPLVHLVMMDRVFNTDRRCAIMVFRGAGKCLDIHSRIASPTGDILLRDVKVGDVIYDRDLNPTEVTYCSEIYNNKKCYEIELADNTKFICSDDHKHFVKRILSNDEEVLTTKELFFRRYIEYSIPTINDKYLSIVDIQEVPSIPTRCISVSSNTQSYIFNDSYITHNTSLFAEYLILFIASFGYLPGFGKVNLMMYVSDSIENGVKNLRRNIEFRYEDSPFLQKMIPNKRLAVGTDGTGYVDLDTYEKQVASGRKFTDIRLEFANNKGHRLVVKGFGSTTGIRGVKELGQRPTLCHIKGTTVYTDMGKHLVEDYYKKGQSRIEKGIKVKLCGLIEEEVVTKEHRYLTKQLHKTRNKEYLDGGKTLSTTKYRQLGLKWVEAQNLSINKSLGNQTREHSYIAKKIDYEEKDIAKIEFRRKKIIERDKRGRIVKHKTIPYYLKHRCMTTDEYWWIYGLYLADGHSSSTKVGFTINNAQRDTVGKKLKHYCEIAGFTLYSETPKIGCYQVELGSVELAREYKKYHKGNSIKVIPNWVLKLEFEKQRQLLLGYIAGDGYIDYKTNQVRINSVHYDTIIKLGLMCERIGLSYHIRTTRAKAFKNTFPNGTTCIAKAQTELRLRDDVKKILGIDIQDNPIKHKEVFIENGYIYRKVKKIEALETANEFIPIETPTHSYQTSFGVSHNCVLDDLLSDEDARSPSIIETIENTVYKAVSKALHPKNQKIIWLGTPFNANDPLYKAVESGAWTSSVFPICERFPVTEEEFKGAWEDRFDYEYVRSEYDEAIAVGRPDNFYQELMLRITNADERLVNDSDIVWFNRDLVYKNRDGFNFYITTDFATSSKNSADYSVILVWAYNNNEDWLLVDGQAKKQDMNTNVNDLFRFVSSYTPLGVGIEVSGQQKAFISWIKSEMLKRNIFFHLLSANNKGEEGIRPIADKFSRFSLFVPRFKQKKVWFANELKDERLMNETLDEISKATKKGFKSKHDDVLDAISMVGTFDAYRPSVIIPIGEELFYENENFEIKNTIF